MSERFNAAPTIDRSPADASPAGEDIAYWESQFEQKALPAGPSASVERAADRIITLSPDEFSVKTTELGSMTTAPEAPSSDVIDAEVVDVVYEDELPSPEKAKAHDTLGKIGHNTLALAAKVGNIIENTPVLQIAELAKAEISNPDNKTVAEKITAFGDKYVPDGWLANKIKERGGIKGTLLNLAISLGKYARDRWKARQESKQKAGEQEESPSDSEPALPPETVDDSDTAQPNADRVSIKTTSAPHQAAQVEASTTTADKELTPAGTPAEIVEDNSTSNPEALKANQTYQRSIEAFKNLQRKMQPETAPDDYDADSPAVEKAFDIDPEDEEAIREQVIAKLVKKRQAKLRRQKARRDKWNTMSAASKERWNQLKGGISNSRIGKACKTVAKWTRLSAAVGKGIGKGMASGARTGVQNHRTAEAERQ